MEAQYAALAFPHIILQLVTIIFIFPSGGLFAENRRYTGLASYCKRQHQSPVLLLGLPSLRTACFPSLYNTVLSPLASSSPLLFLLFLNKIIQCIREYILCLYPPESWIS